MRNLLEFLTKYYHWLLFVLLEAASIALLFSYNSYQGSVWFSSANAVSGKCYELSSKITAYFGLVTINEQLTARNTQLEQELNAVKSKLQKATVNTHLLQAEVPSGYN